MKNEDKHPQEYKQLTGSPGLTSVSDAAKGIKPQTLAEFEKTYNDMARARLDGEESTEPKDVLESDSEYDDIEEAYAKLFEGLAMIARSHSKEEDGEHPDGCSCGKCQ
jgi:hypothetical protein